MDGVPPWLIRQYRSRATTGLCQPRNPQHYLRLGPPTEHQYTLLWKSTMPYLCPLTPTVAHYILCQNDCTILNRRRIIEWTNPISLIALSHSLVRFSIISPFQSSRFRRMTNRYFKYLGGSVVPKCYLSSSIRHRVLQIISWRFSRSGGLGNLNREGACFGITNANALTGETASMWVIRPSNGELKRGINNWSLGLWAKTSAVSKSGLSLLLGNDCMVSCDLLYGCFLRYFSLRMIIAQLYPSILLLLFVY